MEKPKSNTKQDNKLKMAGIVSKFLEQGITTYPRDMISKYCPFEEETYQSVKWHISARNVWNLRNGDPDIIQVFEKVLDDLKETV